METQTDQHTSQLKTSGGSALYVHLHPSYFGLVIYNHISERIEKIQTEIHHDPQLSNSTDRVDGIDSDSVQAWIGEHPDIFNQAYDQVRICVSTPLFQLINNERQATPQLFSVMNSYEEDHVEIMTDRIRNDLYVQFGLDKKLSGLLGSHFELDNIHFGERGLLQLLSAESDLFTDGIYCQLLGQDATVAIISGSRLVFFNKYPVKNREDLLYYILLCFQSHDLDPNEDHLYLCGLIETQSPMYELVYDYIRNVNFMELPGEIHLPNDRPEDFSMHYYINLLSIR